MRAQALLFLTLAAVSATLPMHAVADTPQDSLLWYSRPANTWMTEALPIGNGPMGAMLFGGTEGERMQFNVDSLWTGDGNFLGSYQAFGDVLLELGHRNSTDYRRELNIDQAVHRVSYTANGVRYTRTAFASHPAGVIVMRLTADKPGAYSGNVWLTDTHDARITAEGTRLRAVGALNNGLAYESQLQVIPDGGTVRPNTTVPIVDEAIRGPLDGTRDVNPTLGQATKVVNGWGTARDNLSVEGRPLHIGSRQFSHGIGFHAPGELVFPLNGKYKWVTFSAGIEAEMTQSGSVIVQTWLDGNKLHETQVLRTLGEPVYVSVPVTGGNELKIVVTDAGDGFSEDHINLGNLRFSVSEKEPKPDLGQLGYPTHAWPSWRGILPATGLKFEKCNSLTFVLGADTNYSNDISKNWRGPVPGPKVSSRVNTAAQSSFDTLLANHITDYQRLFNRFQFNVGQSSPGVANKPTNERLQAYTRDKTTDPDLEELATQYGRYLLISCSRPGDLPANLQGVWNDSNSPPWNSDYHSNINLQMNYWPAEVTNLAEMHRPLLDYFVSQIPAARLNTRKQYPGVRGWTTQTENNVYGKGNWRWNPPGSAWYAQHFWEHYAFSRDKDYLRDVAYPVLKEVCEFWEDHLTKRPDGTLVTPDGWSPEHGPDEPGVSYDQQLIWDVFTNYIEASEVLEIDLEYRTKVADMRTHLLGPKVGKWGQLQEWETDRDDPQGKHRHVSHLFAVYPGRQITPRTPQLFKAAQVSLNARGDGGTGWSRAWKIAWWARFQDGDHAYNLLRNLLTYRETTGQDMENGGGYYPNLFDAHPPFQIDGNFGMTAGVAEMLIQSHDGKIHLLPALPAAWATGNARGLRARGGYEVDMAWQNGQLTSATVRSTSGTGVTVAAGKQTIHLNPKPGESFILDPYLK